MSPHPNRIISKATGGAEINGANPVIQSRLNLVVQACIKGQARGRARLCRADSLLDCKKPPSQIAIATIWGRDHLIGIIVHRRWELGYGEGVPNDFRPGYFGSEKGE